MAYVIAQPCIGVKDAACVEACPVDCIHPTKDEPAFDEANHLYIHPEDCTDCGACVPVCPVSAIFEASDLPTEWKGFAQINRDWFRADSSDTCPAQV
jgi:NAD-dependent dihydropyrimidine dehydrogenase PreA subunit